jgi:hypothetical protein
MKVYKATSRLSATAKQAILNTIELHDKYKKSYFWSPSGNAGGRRSSESRFAANNPSYQIQKGTDIIEIAPSYSESCNNCYYSLEIWVNGAKKNIRTLKKIIG